MIFYIFLGAIAAALTLAILHFRSSHGGDLPLFFVVLSTVIGMAALISGTAVAWGNDEGQRSETGRADYTIVAMGNSTAVSGRYQGGVFASYGTLGSQQVINYVWKDQNGGLHLNQVNAGDATVYEQDGDPHLTVTEYTEHVDYSFWVPWIVGDRNGGQHIDLYVPKGSVVTDFKLDASK